MELRQVRKKGASLEISILKGKKNQTRRLQRCIIHPNALHHKGKMCPVDLIDTYLVHRKNLGHNSDHDHLFPQVGAKFQRWTDPPWEWNQWIYCEYLLASSSETVNNTMYQSVTLVK